MDPNLNDQTMFVKLEDYQKALDLLNAMRSKIGEAKNVLAGLEDLKHKEDIELELWKKSIGDIEDKLNFLDSNLTKL